MKLRMKYYYDMTSLNVSATIHTGFRKVLLNQLRVRYSYRQMLCCINLNERCNSSHAKKNTHGSVTLNVDSIVKLSKLQIHCMWLDDCVVEIAISCWFRVSANVQCAFDKHCLFNCEMVNFSMRFCYFSSCCCVEIEKSEIISNFFFSSVEHISMFRTTNKW